MAKRKRRVRFVDSHTAGEPTRLIVSGGPWLGRGSIETRARKFETDHEEFRRWVVRETAAPRGTVGALLLPGRSAEARCGTIFFDTARVLGMCGHGTIGIVTSLAAQGQWPVGPGGIETPVGLVRAERHGDGSVSVENVPAYRRARDLSVGISGHDPVRGDVAWGGNWFFLVRDPAPWPLEARHIPELLAWTKELRAGLDRADIRGDAGARIEHVAVYGPPSRAGLDSRNFVLCPSGEFDRSPCGTGTSAKLACLAEDGELAEGQTWYQESILGTVFEGSVRRSGTEWVPTLRGSAYVTARGMLELDVRDPFGPGPAA